MSYPGFTQEELFAAWDYLCVELGEITFRVSTAGMRPAIEEIIPQKPEAKP